MLTTEAFNQLKSLAAEVSEREGCQLYDLEFSGNGNQRVLRIYIDAKEGHVSIDQCADVSRGLSLLLDVEDIIPGNQYELEVSSPGLERWLKDPWHFEKAVGQTIRVRSTDEIPLPEEVAARAKGKGKLPIVKQLQGQLKAMAENELTIESDGIEWKLPLGIVHKANIVFEFSSQKKGPKKK